MVATTTTRTAISAVPVALMITAPPPLLARIGWPATTAELTGEYVWLAVRTLSVPTPLLVAVLLVAAWTGWGVLVLLAALDVVAILRGRVPRLAAMRLIAASLAGGALTASAAPAFAAVASNPPAAVSTIHEQREHTSEQAEQDAVERTRVLSGFAVNSAETTPQMRETLAATVDLIDHFGAPGARIVVTGHTDPSGDPAYNEELSQRRADAIAEHLRTELGPQTTITATGHAATQPRTETGLGPEAERRAEITYTLTPQPPKPAPTAAPSTGTGQSTPENVPAEPAPTAAMTGLLGIVGGATAGLAGGWALGQRRAPRTTRPVPASSRTAAADEAARVPAPPAAPPSRQLVTEHGAILLAGTHRVDAEPGLAVTGPHASPLIADLLRAADRDTATRLVTTRALVDDVGLTEGELPGSAVCPDLTAAITRADAALLATARDADSGTGADGGWTVLVLHPPVEAELRERLTALHNADSRLLLITSGAYEGAATLDCSEPGEAFLTSPHGYVRPLTGLRVSSEQPYEQAVEQDTPQNPEPVPTPATVAQENTSSEILVNTALHPSCERAETTDADSTPPIPEEPASSDDEPAAPQPEQHRVRLRLFAPAMVVSTERGGEITSGMRSPARTLLALLGLRPDGVSSDEVAECLAPHADPVQSKSVRNMATSNIRSVLRGATGKEDAAVVLVAAGRYRLDESFFDVDVWRFQEHFDRAANSPSPSEKRKALEEAARRHSAPLLSEVDEPWLDGLKQHYRRTASEIYVQLAEYASEPDDKLVWLEKSRREEPHNEVIYQKIMRLQGQIGRDDAVQRTYQLLVEKLAEIAVQPSYTSTRLLEEFASVSPPGAKRRRPATASPARRP